MKNCMYMTNQNTRINKRLRRLAAVLLALTLLVSSSVAEKSTEELLGSFVINHGSRESKKIAITMDDVYEREWVWKAAELCREYGITMTFFPIGINLKEEDRDNWIAVLDGGNEIGSHSYSHHTFRDIESYTALSQLGKFQERLDRVLSFHYQVRWFRPPYGKVRGSNVFRAIRTFGYDHGVRWDVSETNAAKALPKVRNGSILLYHARKRDYTCLTELIPRLLEAGFEPVTMSELFGFDPPERGGELYVYNLDDYRKK